MQIGMEIAKEKYNWRGIVKMKKIGVNRDLNPGPLRPKRRMITTTPLTHVLVFVLCYVHLNVRPKISREIFLAFQSPQTASGCPNGKCAMDALCDHRYAISVNYNCLYCFRDKSFIIVVVILFWFCIYFPNCTKYKKSKLYASTRHEYVLHCKSVAFVEAFLSKRLFGRYGETV